MTMPSHWPADLKYGNSEVIPLAGFFFFFSPLVFYYLIYVTMLSMSMVTDDALILKAFKLLHGVYGLLHLLEISGLINHQCIRDYICTLKIQYF